MTSDQITAILDRLQTWPKSRQEDAARLLLAMEQQDTTPYDLVGEERADIEVALEEIGRGEIATESEVAALFARYRG
jgi:hypothetical protein